MALRLSMTCGPCDRAQALIGRGVKAEGIERDITVNGNGVTRRQRAARGDFDVRAFFTDTHAGAATSERLELCIRI